MKYASMHLFLCFLEMYLLSSTESMAVWTIAVTDSRSLGRSRGKSKGYDCSLDCSSFSFDSIPIGAMIGMHIRCSGG